MSNRNNPGSEQEQEQQERREQELREQQARAAREQLRQAPGDGDDGKNPVIINK